MNPEKNWSNVRWRTCADQAYSRRKRDEWKVRALRGSDSGPGCSHLFTMNIMEKWDVLHPDRRGQLWPDNGIRPVKPVMWHFTPDGCGHARPIPVTCTESLVFMALIVKTDEKDGHSQRTGMTVFYCSFWSGTSPVIYKMQIHTASWRAAYRVLRSHRWSPGVFSIVSCKPIVFVSWIKSGIELLIAEVSRGTTEFLPNRSNGGVKLNMPESDIYNGGASIPSYISSW